MNLITKFRFPEYVSIYLNNNNNPFLKNSGVWMMHRLSRQKVYCISSSFSSAGKGFGQFSWEHPCWQCQCGTALKSMCCDFCQNHPGYRQPVPKVTCLKRRWFKSHWYEFNLEAVHYFVTCIGTIEWRYRKTY